MSVCTRNPAEIVTEARLEERTSRAIKRLAGGKAFQIPSGSLLMGQLRGMTPEDLDADRAGEKFYAVNGFRFLLVAWDVQVNTAARRQAPADGERTGSVLGWS